MTQEEKQLLLKDLCARLPYKVKAMYSKHEETIIAGEYERIDAEGVEVIDGYLDDYCFRIDGYKIHISSIKPYLRSMSSMTEDEREELFQIWKLGKENGSESVTKLLKEIFYKAINENYILKLVTSFENWIDVMAWFNKKHFDYRGLIPMGLVLEAPEGMYNTKTE